MKKIIRGGLVGFGRVAEKAHLPGFTAAHGFEIVAVAEPSAERAQAAGSALPRARLYSSLAELLTAEEGLDFIDVATPPFLHGGQVLQALAAGCHVLCEKPLTLDFDQFQTINAAADKAQKIVFTVHNWAYSPQWEKMLELARGAGPVSHAQLSVLRLKPAQSASGDWRGDAARAGGGILADHGWHNLYLLHRLLSREPTRLTATFEENAESRTEDEATIFMEFPSATAVLHMSWRAGLRYNGALIHAQNATIELHDDNIWLRKDGEKPRPFNFSERLSEGSVHPEWFATMLADFKAALEDPVVAERNRREADFCLKMTRRIYHTVRFGRTRASLGPR